MKRNNTSPHDGAKCDTGTPKIRIAVLSRCSGFDGPLQGLATLAERVELFGVAPASAGSLMLLRRASLGFDEDGYAHPRSLRCLLQIERDAVRDAMGLEPEQFDELEGKDAVFWPLPVVRRYAEALGFRQFRVVAKCGQVRFVIAPSPRDAALEACWRTKECTSIEIVPDAPEWRVETLPAPAKSRASVAQPPERRPTRPLGPQDELVSGALPIAMAIASRFWRGCGGRIDLDDLRQEAQIALFEARKDYQSERGSFETWVRVRVRQALSKFVGHEEVTTLRGAPKAARKLLSLDAPIGEKPDGATLHSILQAADETGAPRKDLPAVVAAAIEELPSRFRQVLLEHDAEGLRMEDIAGRLGICKQRVSKLREEAIERVQKAVARAEARERHRAAVEQIEKAALARKSEVLERKREERTTSSPPPPPPPPRWEDAPLDIPSHAALQPELNEPLTEIPWAEVAERRALGEPDWRIASKLAWRLGINRYWLEKKLRLHASRQREAREDLTVSAGAS